MVESYVISIWKRMLDNLLRKENKLEVIGMCYYRGILRMPWTEHLLNEELMRKRTENNNTIILKITKRQMKFLMKIKRKKGLEKLTLTGRFKCSRHRIIYLTGVRKWMAD